VFESQGESPSRNVANRIGAEHIRRDTYHRPHPPPRPTGPDVKTSLGQEGKEFDVFHRLQDLTLFK